MLFPTFTFFAFLVPVLILNWTLKRWPLAWRLYLLLVSWFFYATWDLRFLGVLLALTLLTHLAASKLVKDRVRTWLVLGILANAAALLVFKYYDFFRVSLEGLAGRFGFTITAPVLEFLLPIGLSFYALRGISYLVDVYKERTPHANLLDFGIYMAFFPQLLSGPIARPNEFLPQLKDGGRRDIPDAHLHIARILLGLLKKLVLASFFLPFADAVFAAPGTHAAPAVLFGIYAYAMVIYADFSGYTDMAIGIAGLLGFDSPANFNMPYRAASIQEFWRRWHISFSRWLQDYVYFPLGGSRVGAVRRSFNLLVTMLVSGLWHGAGLTYLVWGAAHGVGLLAHRVFKDIRGRARAFEGRHAPLLAWFLSFHFVALAWVLFRAADLEEAGTVFRALFGGNMSLAGIEPVGVIVLILTFIFVLQEERILEAYARIESRLPIFFEIVLTTAVVIALIELGPDIVPPFIYFQF